MDQNQSGSTAEQRTENVNRKATINDPVTRMTATKPKQETFRQRWNAVQLSKTSIVWICLAMILGTMLAGFTWGGWVTGDTAQRTAVTLANDAVVQRLTAICVAQFQQDLTKDEKLVELKAASSYQRGNYVKEQGWATMPGDEESETKVATECAKLLVQLN